MNIYWYYYKSLLLASIAISFLFSVISLQLTLSSVSLDMDNFGLKKFVILYATVGFSLATLLDTFFIRIKSIYFIIWDTAGEAYFLGLVFLIG